MKRRDLTEEERELWREGTKHIKKLTKEKAAPAPQAPSRREQTKPAQSAPKATPLLSPPKRSGPPRQLSAREAKKQMSTPTEATLDLHGLSRTQAYEKLCRFITACQKNNTRRVLIITGKGKGVLQTALPGWLLEPPLCNLISAIAPDLHEKGGGGALRVLVKKHQP